MQNKTIGLIGGIGWASTMEYYRLINEGVMTRLGASHSARIILFSLDQFDFTSRAANNTLLPIEDFLVNHGKRLKDAGADFFLLCANGAHRFAAAIVPEVGLPFISIVEETAKRVALSKVKKVGLLGVKQTMSGNFYHASLAKYGIETLTPTAGDQDIIHDLIYVELVHNTLTEKSRKIFIEVIDKLVVDGAEAIILGCTEIPLLIRRDDVDIELFNTTEIHCDAALEFAFGT